MVDSEESQVKMGDKSVGSIVSEPLTLIAFGVVFLTWIRLFFQEGTLYSVLPLVSGVLGLLSVYFTYLYLKGDKKRIVLVGIPALIFITTLFMYYSGAYPGSILQRDFTVFAVISSLFLLAYSISVHKVVRFDVSLVLALFLSTFILHVMPAYSPYLAALDPYFYYKLSNAMINTGYLPDHEYMVYPLINGLQGTRDIPPGIEYSRSSFFLPVFMAYAAKIDVLAGLTLYDTAILYPAVFSALTVIVLYLLVAELFSEAKPYNKIAAVIAAFILMFSPAYAAKASATNCEDDTLGMFLTITSLLFFTAGFKRRDLRFVYLAGLSFFLLRLSWGGYLYIVVILGVFSVGYSVAKFLKDEPCFNHLTYLFASLVPSFFTPLIMHPRGGLPILKDFLPYHNNLVALGGALLVGIVLEYVRVRKGGKNASSDKVKPKNILEKEDSWIAKNPKIALTVVVVIIISGLLYVGIDNLVNVLKTTLESRKQDDVIKKTIAEQNPTAGSIASYLAVGPQKFSILFLYCFIMIPVLLYVGFRNADFGSLFVLSWAVPMIYAVYFKSQYLFVASVPIIVLGSTVGLYSIARKKDLESLRIVGLMLVLVVPLITVPFYGAQRYNSFIAMTPMYMGPSGDRHYWQPALLWLRENTKPNSGVLTWWDYGHWITSESQRSVLIDNLQADPHQIQDVARFFVNKTSEEEAFETFKVYRDKYSEVTNIYPDGVDLRYIAIDWTMIGKGSALHFIATGDIDTKADGSFKNYMLCGFVAEASDATPRVMSDEDGNMFLGRRIIFGCGYYVAGIEFIIKEDTEFVGVNAILNYGQKVPWDRWVEQNDASLLGVQPLYQILSLAMDRPKDQLLPQYRTLIYVPQEFSDFMMTRLYLSDHIDTIYNEQLCEDEANVNHLGCTSYLSAGLYNRDYNPLENFELIRDFSSGYVRVYELVNQSKSESVDLALEEIIL